MDRFTNQRIVNSALGSTSSGTLLSGECKRLVISSSEDAYINLNTDIAVSNINGIYISADKPYTIDLVKAVKFNAIRDTADGRITILELF